jgi:chromosome segregation ATPase
MAEFDKIKTEIDKLLVEKNNLEKQITTAKAQHDLYVKELDEKYKITPEQIPGHLEELKTKLVELQVSLTTKLTTLREYVMKLKLALSES